MFEDTLWIYTSIAGALLGAAFLFYIKDTRVGLWAYSQFDKTVDYCRDYLGWTWLNQDPDAWKKVNPKIAAKIGELESRIENLENPENGMMQK
jgi:hypothetical protein